MKNLQLVSLLLFFVFSISVNILAKDNFEKVSFATEDGGTIQGALFKASPEKVVLFAHGAIFDKESWYFLAEKFQARGVTALSIDFRGYGKSKTGSTSSKSYDILGAISYLKKKGYNNINIIGGSMGGAAVLAALTLAKQPVAKVVLLAPAGGSPLSATKTEKLFIVTKGDGLYNRVQEIYNKSSEPKKIKVYNGSAHAQHMFKEDYAEELINLILGFIGGV